MDDKVKDIFSSNLNIVECKVIKPLTIDILDTSSNLNIVECKGSLYIKSWRNNRSSNLNIVECKGFVKGEYNMSKHVVI